jgi:hypothetical protein
VTKCQTTCMRGHDLPLDAPFYTNRAGTKIRICHKCRAMPIREKQSTSKPKKPWDKHQRAHCKNGHELDYDVAYRNATGRRIRFCEECRGSLDEWLVSHKGVRD